MSIQFFSKILRVRGQCLVRLCPEPAMDMYIYLSVIRIIFACPILIFFSLVMMSLDTCLSTY